MLIDTYRNVLHLSELQFFQLKSEEKKKKETAQNKKTSNYLYIMIIMKGRL